MTPQKRLLLLSIVIVFVAIALALVLVSPPAPLVGARARDDVRLERLIAERPDLSGAATLLEKIPIWGVGRDGGPLKPKSAAKDAEETKIPTVSVVAVVVRPEDRYLVASVDGESEFRVVREEGVLPDGRVVKSIEPSRVEIKIVGDEEPTLTIKF